MRRTPTDATARKSLYAYPRLISWTLPLIGYFLAAVALYNLLYRVSYYIKISPLGVYDQRNPPAWAIFRGGFSLYTDYMRNLPDPVDLFVPALWFMVQAIFGLLFALVLIMLFNNLLPSLRVLDDHLEVRYGTRWLNLPWAAISKIRSAEFFDGKWFVVLIEAEEGYLKPIHQAYSLLFGASGGPGIIVTSNIKGFDELIKEILGHRLSRYATPRTYNSDSPPTTLDTVLQEDYFAAPLKVALEPHPSIGRLTGMNIGGQAAEEPDENALEDVQPHELPPPREPITRGQAIAAAALLASIFTTTYLVDGLMFGPNLLNIGSALALLGDALILFIMTFAEPLIGAGVIYSIGELVANKNDRDLLRLELLTYPFVQMPRVLFLLAALTALVAHAGWLMVLIWLASVFYGAYLSVIYTMRLYPLKPPQAYLGGAATLVYGLLLLLVYGALHFWRAS